MSFKDLNLKREYRSYRSDIINEFYIPVLNQSVLYRRAVGFFSSSALAEIMKGISGLYKNGGKIQLIASPKLSEEDIKAINLGYKLRKEVIEENLISQLEEAEDYFESERLNILAHLIANNRLDIKIAVLKSHNQIGIYHEKLGLVYDNYGNEIAFTGSLNETANALLVNYESIDVFTSWKDSERVNDKKMAFESIWNDNEEGLEVLEFPKVKEAILKKYKREKVNTKLEYEYIKNLKEKEESERIFDVENNKYNIEQLNKPKIPSNVKLYDYQIEAIKNWKDNNYCGIYDMATGTGKTFTGIASAVELYKDLGGELAIIIVCPYTHLVEQWVDDLNVFNIEPIVAYSESTDKNYKKKIRDSIFDYNLGVIDYFCLITTNATYRSDYVQTQLKKLKKSVLLIIDEAHNFGAMNLANKLLDNFKYRLALSATLDRHNDEYGTSLLYSYFGKKCIEYSLERAIKEKKLTPYYYYPIPVYLSEEELEKYKLLSRDIAKCIIKRNGSIKLNDRGKRLSLERARVVAGAINKIGLLEEKIKKYQNDSHILVYCGATNVLDDDIDYDDISMRQIDCITRLLGNKMGMKVAQFTARENNAERKIIQEDFKKGTDLQVLVAIKCLDEGVNIPKIKVAFILASTTNPKEYIQRRGRVLRLAEGKPYAEIYDFVTLPRQLDSVKNYLVEEINSDKSLVKNELKRIIEFKDISLNPSFSDKLIDEIMEAYDMNYSELENLKVGYDYE
ncbi:MAG: DEAD/DEAH box helicase family protein [Clostridium sp.]|nr:DEAD/DEAH box helicase family protein [Clostridium sp.]